VRHCTVSLYCPSFLYFYFVRVIRFITNRKYAFCTLLGHIVTWQLQPLSNGLQLTMYCNINNTWFYIKQHLTNHVTEQASIIRHRCANIWRGRRLGRMDVSRDETRQGWRRGWRHNNDEAYWRFTRSCLQCLHHFRGILFCFKQFPLLKICP